MSILEYHVLLALAGEPLYGYAIKDAVAEESAGTQTPRAGSLYRVLGRLLANGLVKETAMQGGAPAHPGHERRYYALTATGRKTLLAEAQRLKRTAGVAERRLGSAHGQT